MYFQYGLNIEAPDLRLKNLDNLQEKASDAYFIVYKDCNKDLQ